MLMVNHSPTRYSFKGLVFRPDKWKRSKTNLTVGIAQINRLKYIADGDWGEGNYSHLIDLSMISVERNYVGGLNSRTIDHRISMAGRIPGNERLSLGMTYIDFECTTTFYLQGSGRTCQIVAYETMDFGAFYKLNNRRQFGLTLRNPLEDSKPNRITLDIENIFGEYSNEMRKCSFIMIRSGYERDMPNGLKVRGGIIYPLRARTSTLGDLKSRIPSPKIDATLGAGYTYNDYTLDFAVYGDPGKSYVMDALKVGSVFTLRRDF